MKQMEYAKLAYEIAMRAYSDEQVTHEHLWRRFRDTVSLAMVVAAGLGGALLAVPNPTSSTSLFIAGSAVGIGLVAVVVATLHLYEVFQGDFYESYTPRMIQAQFRQRTSEFSELDLGRLLPVRGVGHLQRGGELPCALLGTVLEDIAAGTLEAAITNYERNLNRSKRLHEARDPLVFALSCVLVAWIAIAMQ